MSSEGKGGRCVRLTTLLPSRADCLEILGASNSWKPKSLYWPAKGLLFAHERQKKDKCSSDGVGVWGVDV
jgi:hypothetical protein